MIGTLVNTAAVISGGALGLAAGKRLPARVRDILTQALGLCVLYVGADMALEGARPLLTVGSVILGGLAGELLGVEQGLARFADWLKRRLGFSSPRFVEGFVTASVMYLAGAMTIVGCIRDGVLNDPSTLYVKSVFDGVAALALASSLGAGVAFSALSVIVVQGLLTLFSSSLAFLQAPEVLNAVTSTGGVLILGIGISVLEIRPIRTGNLLPAMLLAILGALYA